MEIDYVKSKSASVDVKFHDLVYTVKRFKSEKKQILQGISGYFPSGNLIGILGPSGAGKSTLLNIVSGFQSSGFEGQIYINDQLKDSNTFKKISCYITQDNDLNLLLTVEENMKFAADLKLGTASSDREKADMIHDLLKNLGLDGTEKTRTSKLSGGQMKRLSVALELLSNPIVMFLDEPTTGLDSFGCNLCIKHLKQLAKMGKTIICTIHQPSATLFKMFDLIYIISQGQCLYQGSVDNVMAMFDDVEVPCEVYHNPADHVIELASGDYGNDKIALMVDKVKNGKLILMPALIQEGHNSIRLTALTRSDTPNLMSADAGMYVFDGGSRIVISSNNSSIVLHLLQTCNSRYQSRNSIFGGTLIREVVVEIERRMENMVSEIQSNITFRRPDSNLYELGVLLKREILKTRRNMTLTHLRLLGSVLISCSVSALFWKTGEDASRLWSNYNVLLAFIISNVLGGLMLTILVFPTELSVLRKEIFNGYFRLRNFFIAITIVDFPISLASCIILTTSVYTATGQPMELHRFMMFFATALFVTLIAQSLGLFLGSALDIKNGIFIGSYIHFPMMLVSGFALHLSDLSPYFYWSSYGSYLRYSLNSMSAALYRYNRTKLPCHEEKFCLFRHGDKFLDEIGVMEYPFSYNMSMLLLIYIILRLAAYISIKIRIC